MVKWEEPPAEAFEVVRKGTYGDLALALRKRPGAWALVDRTFASEESAKNMASNVRRGGVKSMKKGEYEAVSKGVQVWVRYQPGQGDDGDDGSAEPTDTGFASRVRAWAKVKGIPVSNHGRIADGIIQRYESETGEKRP